MSAEDPQDELQELFVRIESGAVSDRAVPFFDRFEEKATDILTTIESMRANGVDPTFRQARALRNIYLGCCYWLDKTPEESKIGPDPDFRSTKKEDLLKQIDRLNQA